MGEIALRKINRKIKKVKRIIQMKFYNFFNDVNNGMKQIDKTHLNKILIVNSSPIGNLIAYTPLISSFKEFNNKIIIDFITEGVSKEVIIKDKRIRRIYSSKNKEELKKERYDLVIYTGNIGIKEHKLLKYINAKYYAGTCKDFKIFNLVVEDNDEYHILKIMDDLSKNILGYKTSGKFHLEIDIEKEIEIKEKFICEKNKKIFFNKYASTLWRDLSDDDYVKIVECLIEEGYFVIGSYPPSKKENHKKLIGKINSSKYFSLENTASLMDTMCLIKNSDLVISVDTSIIHIASAFNIPVIGLYIQSSDYKKWYPTSEKSLQIVFNTGRREGKRKPIIGIEEKRILNKIENILEKDNVGLEREFWNLMEEK